MVANGRNPTEASKRQGSETEMDKIIECPNKIWVKKLINVFILTDLKRYRILKMQTRKRGRPQRAAVEWGREGCNGRQRVFHQRRQSDNKQQKVCKMKHKTVKWGYKSRAQIRNDQVEGAHGVHGTLEWDAMI
jgi:predicted DNA-binding WGR domain protein